MTHNAASDGRLERAIIEALACADAVDDTLIGAILQHCLSLLDRPPSTVGL